MSLATIASWLLIIGGLNWLLFGLFKKDLFGFLKMGMDHMLAKVVYILVGLSALYQLFM
jgi:uncharacterized membrane protein YuzA (DUF378 family)